MAVADVMAERGLPFVVAGAGTAFAFIPISIAAWHGSRSIERGWRPGF